MRDFVNPYNFIHFPKQKATAYEDQDTHTGVIHYTLTTKTPLFFQIPVLRRLFRSQRPARMGQKKNYINRMLFILIQNWSRAKSMIMARMEITMFRSFRAVKCEEP